MSRYAVVEISGRQWKVEPGSRLEVNRLAAEAGSTHTVDRVLLTHDGSDLKIGHPYVEGAQVVCEVVDHHRGPKVIAYHFRRRENWRKTVGHRQPLTRLIVKDILLGAATAASSVVRETAPAGERPAVAEAKVTVKTKATRPRAPGTTKKQVKAKPVTRGQ